MALALLRDEWHCHQSKYLVMGCPLNAQLPKIRNNTLEKFRQIAAFGFTAEPKALTTKTTPHMFLDIQSCPVTSRAHRHLISWPFHIPSGTAQAVLLTLTTSYKTHHTTQLQKY